VIRPLTAADHDAAAAVYNHYVETTTATFQTTAVTSGEWAAESLGGEPGRHGAWAVEDGGAFAGYVLVTPFKSRCAYRDTAEVTVYLAPGRTGRGLGREALRFVDEHAGGPGLHALLAVVCAENEPSLRAFERAGYERCALLREVGSKFGRLLDVVYLERVVGSYA
jgi:L-amino acid N-acyltransferase YncA